MRAYSPSDRYGRLVPIALFAQAGKPYVRLLCLCDCGTLKVFYKDNLARGFTQSCGCLQKMYVSCRRARHLGSHKGSPLYSTYRAWTAMRDRCYRTTDANYPNYGGRGIAICARWRNSFENFLTDMGPRPGGQHGHGVAFSIDRVNNDGDYEPGNCRWATWVEQAGNRRPARRNRWQH